MARIPKNEKPIQRMRRLLLNRIKKMEKQGYDFGNLKERIPKMRTRDLERLYDPKKAGKRGVYAGLEKRAKKPVDGGEVIADLLLETLELLEQPTPLYKEERGVIKRRRQEDIEESAYSQTFLITLIHTLGSEIGYSKIGWRLEEHSDRVIDLIITVLYDYKEKIIQARTELAQYINGGSLTMEQAKTIGESESYEDELEDYE